MTTPAKSLKTLEYDKIIGRLVSFSQTALGKALALALTPSSVYEEVIRRQRLTAEGRKILEMKPNVSLGGVHDIGGLVYQASLGHALEPGELLDVRETLSQGRTVHETLDRLRVFVPHLAEIADRIADFRAITAEIGRCIGPRGEVLDAASPVLAELRREARVAHDRLQARLSQLLNAARPAIQEPIVTLRGGRYVIPVKAELRAQVPGIVHDVSASGATVFLEPLETVEMGNRWREMLAEEQREIARILRQLSASVGSRADEIAAATEALAEIDLTLAKARLGTALAATELPHEGNGQPWIREEPGALLLVNARHPLLGKEQGANAEVVPVTVWLGKDAGRPRQEGEVFSVLLITGPNTGGKTVALKTAGLLALMAQAGLPVPAESDSRLPVFDAVYADIGDEQSIEQSLSTFSSHIGNIVSVLRAATERSLVLLDELAAGTDPAEGSALAKAILVHLLEVGCLTIATTHHGELKAFAHVTPGVMNASVEFDAETLSPTYRLHIGLPGQSNALAIAQRLGMPDDVLERARADVGEDRLAVESLITHLHREKEAAETATAEQRAAAREAQKARAQVTKELQALESNRDRLIEKTRQEMEAELSQARLRLREAAKEMQRAERTNVFERAASIEAAQKDVVAVEESLKQVEQKKKRRRKAPLPSIAPGDRVFLRDVPTPGEAITEPDATGELEVSLGALRAKVNVTQIERVEATEKGRDARDVGHALDRFPSEFLVSPELDLRGMTVDEALMLIDQRLDEASRAGVSELRIIHGKGTGTLRRAVREMLGRHALVQGHEPAAAKAGGEGVTVVAVAH